MFSWFCFIFYYKTQKMATIRPEKSIKKTPKEIREYLKSFSFRNENKAMMTLNIGVNINTRSPMFITPWGWNPDKLDKSSPTDIGSSLASRAGPGDVNRNKARPKIKMMKAE